MNGVTRSTPIDQLPELLRVEEVAIILDCGRGTVYDLCRKNELASVRIGRLLRVPRSALVAMKAGDRA